MIKVTCLQREPLIRIVLTQESLDVGDAVSVKNISADKDSRSRAYASPQQIACYVENVLLGNFKNDNLKWRKDKHKGPRIRGPS